MGIKQCWFGKRDSDWTIELRYQWHGSGGTLSNWTCAKDGENNRNPKDVVWCYRLHQLWLGKWTTLWMDAGSRHCSWYKENTSRRDRAQTLQVVVFNCTVNCSPSKGQVHAVAVWCAERYNGAVESAETGLQITGEAKYLGFVRQNISWEVEELWECAGMHIEDLGICEWLQPLCQQFNW